MRQTFSKDERLCSRELLDQIFEKGHSFSVPPFRIIWLAEPANGQSPARVVLSVPKKRVRKATGRNRTKRLMKEAYRKHKSPLYQALENSGQSLSFVVLCLSGKALSYKEVEDKIILSLQRLIKECCPPSTAGHSEQTKTTSPPV